MDTDDRLRLLAPLGRLIVTVREDGMVCAYMHSCVLHDVALTRAYNEACRDPAHWEPRPAPAVGLRLRADVKARFADAARPLEAGGATLADALEALFNVAITPGMVVVRAYDTPSRPGRLPERAHEALSFDHYDRKWIKTALLGPV